MRLPYSWKQPPPKLYTILRCIFKLAGIEPMDSTASPLSISQEKSLLFTFYNYLVILNFLSPTIKFFHIPFANFFIYLLDALSGALPFYFFYLRSIYLAFLAISGNANSNQGASSILSAYIMQIRRSLTLSSDQVPSFNNIKISLFNSFEMIPLAYIYCSTSQNSLSLLFLASLIIQPALVKCHQIFLNFSLFSVYSSDDRPINLELSSFDCSPSFISEIKQFFLFSQIQSWRDNSKVSFPLVTLLPVLLILQIFSSKLAYVMPWARTGKQSDSLLKMQRIAQLSEEEFASFQNDLATEVNLDLTLSTKLLDCSLEGLQMNIGWQVRALNRLVIQIQVGRMHIEWSMEQYPKQEYYILAMRETT